MPASAARKQPPERANHLVPYRWSPGQSGNPRGSPKGTRRGELTTRDSVNTWVKHAFELVRAGRAKTHLANSEMAAAKLVIDIKALREA